MNKRFFFLPLGIFFLCASSPRAQEINFANENSQYNFPETSGLRDTLIHLDSMHASETARRQALDDAAALYDSVARGVAPYAGYPLFLKGNANFSPEADALLRTCAARAKTLYDSSLMLRSLAIQRNVVRVDSLWGIVDLIPFDNQKIYRIHCADSAERFVQMEEEHTMGDTVSVFAVRFGRKIYPSQSQPGAWEMSEGIQAAGDSTYDVLRETAKPHIYEVYSAFIARFDSMHAVNEPALDSALSAFSKQLQNDIHTAEKRIAADDESIRLATRRLWADNLLLSAQHSIRSGEHLKAVDILLRMESGDSSVDGIAATTLAQARRGLDSVSHITYFGGDGLKNMALVPGGSVLLHTGEHFEPGAFYMDVSPVTNEEFNAFEKSTGYNTKGNWRAGYTTANQSQDAVQNLSFDDKTAFAKWASKRPATPQEIEYAAASGFPALANRNAHPKTANAYGVNVVADGFYCALDLSSFPLPEQEHLKEQAEQRAREIEKIIDAANH